MLPRQPVQCASLSRAVALILVLLACACGFATAPTAPLRTVGEVMRLSERQAASGRQVHLRGVVTLLDPDWNLLAIQDQTGAVLVDAAARPPQLRIGDSLEITGATSLDDHVRSIVSVRLRVVGALPPPPPQRVSAEALACGEALYRLIEVEITPEEAGLGDGTHTARFSIRQPCHGVTVFGRLFRRHSPASLVGRRIRVRGVPLPSFTPTGQLDRVRVMFEDDANVDILDPPIPDESVAQSASLPRLTTILAVKTLPRPETMRGYPVSVEGTVTSQNGRHSGYFLQDDGVAVFVFASDTLPRPRDRVRVEGRTEQGGYAPVIRQQSIERLGTAPLPAPVKIVPGDLLLGRLENLWSEIEAVPMAVMTDGQTAQLEVRSGARELPVWFSTGASVDTLRPFIDAGVRIHGVHSPLYTSTGVLTGFRIFTSSPANVEIVEPVPKAPQARSLASLRRFDIRGFPRHRIRTAGSVTSRSTDGHVWMQDDDVALQVLGDAATAPPLNTRAVVDGFLVLDGGVVRLDHVRWVDVMPAPAVSPIPTAAETMLLGELDGMLVVVEGYLENRRTSGGVLQLGLQVGRSRFHALLEAPGSATAFPDIRPGALLRLTGVCEGRSEPGTGGVRWATLRLRGADDIVLLRPAAWWDVRRALYAASGLSLLLLIALFAALRLRQNLATQLAVRSKLEEQLRHAQKMESVGRLAGGIAHDFNNYLTIVVGYSDLLLDSLASDETARVKLEAIRDVGAKAAALTRQLLAFSRKQRLQPTACDLNKLITDAQATLLPLIGEQVKIVTRLEATDLATIDPDQFFQILVNLSVNARDAMPRGGQLILETANVRGAEGREASAPGSDARVRVSVTDTGVGMERAVLDRIFDPFFTTKERGHGTGLGLAVVFGIVKQSGGSIEVDSTPGKGTSFHVYVPVATSQENLSPSPGPPAPGRSGETILVVEDQVQVGTLIRIALERHGYRVLGCSRPADALELLSDQRTAIDLLLTDIVMPEMSGVALAAEAGVRRPGIRVLYMSGYSDDQALARGVAYLRKPFTPEELVGEVRRVLDRPG